MKLDIHQIYFAQEQEAALDPAFIPLPNLENPFPERREFYLFEQFHRGGAHYKADLSGLFSHKFGQKTGVSGETFIAWVKSNPGYDTYFINPFPDTVYWSFNVWEQGEKSHTGLIKLAQQAFDALGYTIDLKKFPRTDLQTTCFSNFWIATPAFWDAFMAFALPVYHHMLEEPHTTEYFKNTYHDSEAEMFPFIMERLFSTFIALRPEYKVLSFPVNLTLKGRSAKVLTWAIDAIDRRPKLKNSLGFRLCMDMLATITYIRNRNHFFLTYLKGKK
jgi:hypothetical protein